MDEEDYSSIDERDPKMDSAASHKSGNGHVVLDKLNASDPHQNGEIGEATTSSCVEDSDSNSAAVPAYANVSSPSKSVANDYGDRSTAARRDKNRHEEFVQTHP